MEVHHSRTGRTSARPGQACHAHAGNDCRTQEGGIIIWFFGAGLRIRPGTPPPLRLEGLRGSHAIAAFHSGDAAIDAFMHGQAIIEQGMGLSSITVALDSATGRVIGYFSLSPLSIRLDPRVLRALGLPEEKIAYPAVGGYLLGRLGIDEAYQRQGTGSALVAVAVQRCREGREGTGGVFLAVDAKTDELVGYYARLGFVRIGEGRRLEMRL